MKAIVITAAALMTGAGIYGVVDYTRQSDSPKFKQLYQEEQVVPDPPPPPPAPPKPVAAVVATPAKPEGAPPPPKAPAKPKKPAKKKKKKVNMEMFSRGALERPAEFPSVEIKPTPTSSEEN